MAQVCDICGKSPRFGKTVSHSHRVTSRRFTPNIQRVRLHGRRSLRVCTSCIKAGKVPRT